MKTLKSLLTVFASLAVLSQAFAGPEQYSGKEMKQTMAAPAPVCEWYRDTEWNVSVWGTYAFIANDYPRMGSLSVTGIARIPHNSFDRYLESDHAWGGGIDAKYFFHRYFGVGLEGYVVDSNRHFADFEGPFGQGTLGQFSKTTTDRRAVGSVLGTLTLRYPIGCSRFAPYAWAGAGAIFGGGEETRHHFVNGFGITTESTDSQTKAVGQFGGGFEVRITPHIGVINDFSWNVVEGTRNNFGMVRSGLNFAF